MTEQRITVDPNVHFGKPCIADTRIPVLDVLELVSHGCTFQQIIDDCYPDLKPDDIRAAIRYAMDVVRAEDIHISAAG